jgi:hypothetical protein
MFLDESQVELLESAANFTYVIHGWIELVEPIKNIAFKTFFDQIFAEKFSKYRERLKKWEKDRFRANAIFRLFMCLLMFWKEFIRIQHQKVSMSI